MRIVKRYEARADISALALFASVAGADISAPGTKRVNIWRPTIYPHAERNTAGNDRIFFKLLPTTKL